MDELFRDDDQAPDGPADADPAEDPEPDPADEEMRDLAIAEEVFGGDDGDEVTSAPSDEDQSETSKIVIEAVESGSSPAEVESSPEDEVPEAPTLPSPIRSRPKRPRTEERKCRNHEAPPGPSLAA